MNIFPYIFTTIFVLIIDIAWLIFNKNNYNKLVNNIQGSNIDMNYLGGGLSYVILLISLFTFSIPMIKQRLNKNKDNLLSLSIIYGGGLGFLMYGLFNTTNLGIFKNYDPKIALMDTLWGFTNYSLGSYFFFSIEHII